MDVYLVDGTYELFRHFYALPSQSLAAAGRSRQRAGVLGSVLGMLESGVTHLGVATDHVIESFRNDIWAGYKTGEGIDPRLWEQFPLLEDTLAGDGRRRVADGRARGGRRAGRGRGRAAADPAVDRVLICTPDKDLAQCVVGERIVQMDRRNRKILDEAGVVAKFGVSPASIPDFLALVGDSADGYPGLPGWGAKTAAAVLARYRTSKRSRTRRDSGMSLCAAPIGWPGWPRRWPSSARWPTSSVTSRRSERTAASSIRSRSCAGWARRKRSPRSVRASRSLGCSSARSPFAADVVRGSRRLQAWQAATPGDEAPVSQTVEWTGRRHGADASVRLHPFLSELSGPRCLSRPRMVPPARSSRQGRKGAMASSTIRLRFTLCARRVDGVA